MESFSTHTGVAVPLRRSNVDTDQIIPAVYLKRVTRTGFEDGLFAAWRNDPAFVLNDPAYAAGSNMPWEQPLNQILESIQGPVAKVVSVIIIIVTGLTLAFGETSGGFRRLIQIVFGLSIAFAASSFFLTFFQFGGGVTV